MSGHYPIWAYRALDMRAFPIYFYKERQTFEFISTISGKNIKIRFTNIYGENDLILKDAFIWVNDIKKRLTINNGETLLIKHGEEVYSDPVAFDIKAKNKIKIEFVIEDTLCDTACSFYKNDMCEVNHYDLDGNSVTLNTPFLNNNALHNVMVGFDRVIIESDDKPLVITAFGDSITHMSRWTAPLCKRLLNEYPNKFVMTNMGVCGNRVLHDASRLSGNGLWFSKKGIDRFEEDCYNDCFKSDVIFLNEGINDILHPNIKVAPYSENVEMPKLYEGLKQMIDIAHNHNSYVLLGTLTPFNGCKKHWTKELENLRNKLNEIIRSSNDYDYLLDWDNLVKDKNDNTRLDPDGGSEDNLHPGVKGGITMANYVDIDLFMKNVRGK